MEIATYLPGAIGLDEHRVRARFLLRVIPTGTGARESCHGISTRRKVIVTYTV